MAKGKALSVQFVWYTEQNYYFQIDGASRYLVYDPDNWSTY